MRKLKEIKRELKEIKRNLKLPQIVTRAKYENIFLKNCHVNVDALPKHLQTTFMNKIRNYIFLEIFCLQKCRSMNCIMHALMTTFGSC